MLLQKQQEKNYCKDGAADDIGISRYSYCKYTTDLDPYEPSVNSLFRICKWLGVPMETFFEDKLEDSINNKKEKQK